MGLLGEQSNRGSQMAAGEAGLGGEAVEAAVVIDHSNTWQSKGGRGIGQKLQSGEHAGKDCLDIFKRSFTTGR
jgi:hypothetical protein